MKTFYDVLATYYDEIFPTSIITRDFLLSYVCSPSRILDVGCGTGNMSIALEQAGHLVSAIDLSPSLLNQFIQKNSTINPIEMNMLDINQLEGSFDLIFCIGNTLPHLNSLEELSNFLNSCYNKLNDGATLILQIVNIDYRPAQLPTIKTPHIVFERNYQYIDNKTLFKTRLNHTHDNVVELLTLESHLLVDLLKNSNFHNINTYGNFKGEPFNPEASFPLIVSGQKPSTQKL